MQKSMVSILLSILILLATRAAAAKRSLSHLSVCLTEHGRCTTGSLAPEKETAAIAEQPKSPFVHSTLFLSAPTSPPLHSLPWGVLKQILKDWRTLNLIGQPHQGQLENYFQNPQLGHFTLIGQTGS